MSNKIETSDGELEEIFLISSGYEWECPNCGRLNHEIEITAKVTCSDCSKGYEVMDANHAWE